MFFSTQGIMGITGLAGLADSSQTAPSVSQADFDEAYYLQRNPDIAAYIKANPETFRSGYDHFMQGGWAEGRAWRLKSAAVTPTPTPTPGPVVTPAPTVTPAPVSTAGTINLPIIGRVPTTVALIGAGAIVFFFLSEK